METWIRKAVVTFSLVVIVSVMVSGALNSPPPGWWFASAIGAVYSIVFAWLFYRLAAKRMLTELLLLCIVVLPGLMHGVLTDMSVALQLPTTNLRASFLPAAAFAPSWVSFLVAALVGAACAGTIVLLRRKRDKPT